MKLSKLISKLERIYELHGDLECVQEDVDDEFEKLFFEPSTAIFDGDEFLKYTDHKPNTLVI